MSYEEHITYRFEVLGQWFELHGDEEVHIEELDDKSDWGLGGVLVNVGKWKLDPDYVSHWIEYGSQEIINAVEDYVNEHGIPWEVKPNYRWEPDDTAAVRGED